MSLSQAIFKKADQQLIDNAITIAKKAFIRGQDDNRAFDAAIEKGDVPSDKVHPVDFLFRSHRFVKDNYFPIYLANVIPDTNFIASIGPGRTQEEVASFLDTIVFNPNLSPVQYVVALGDALNSNFFSGISGDFFDYISDIEKIREYKSAKGTTIKTECLKIEGKIVAHDGRVKQREAAVLNTTPPTAREHADDPRQMVQSKIKIQRVNEEESKGTPPTEIIMNIQFYSLSDNTSLCLAKAANEQKEYIWQAYQHSLQHTVLVHCHAGVGRTGHFILILEVLRHFDDIFSNGNAAQAARKILDIVNRIRRTRPGLVWTNNQFEQAIQNAQIMRNYALEQGYNLRGEYRQILTATEIPQWRKEPSVSSLTTATTSSLLATPNVLSLTTVPTLFPLTTAAKKEDASVVTSPTSLTTPLLSKKKIATFV